jgi:hypothetical protein
MHFIYEDKKNNFLNFDNFKSSLLGIIVSSFSSFSKIKNQVIYFLNFTQEKNEKLNLLNSSNISITFNNEIYTQNNYTILENKKFNFEIPKDNELEIKKFNNLITSYLNNLDTSKNNTILLLINLYNNNACEILFHLYYYNETKYNNCLFFWSSFVTQGIEQSLIQLEIEIFHIIDVFVEINNSNEVLNNLEIIKKTYSNCDDFILNYLYLSFRETQFILRDLEKDNSDIIYRSIERILFFFILGNIFLFIFFLILLYFVFIQFKDFINFIIIFPLEYLIEEENLYLEIIKLHNWLY